MASSDNATPVKDEMTSAPARCANGCGFFGNQSTGGMCSKCWKETMAKQAVAAPAIAAEASAPVAAPVPAPTPVPAPVAPAAAAASPAAELKAAEPAPNASPAAASSSSAPAPTVEAAASPAGGVVRPSEQAVDCSDPDGEPPKKVQANTSRCWTCNRKIGLLGFQCKCEFYFCSEHRYSDRHECAFDFKSQGKALLEKANPTIAPAKMESM